MLFCSTSFISSLDRGIYVLRETHIVHFPRFAHLKSLPGATEAMLTYPLSTTLAAFSINARQALSNVHGNMCALLISSCINDEL